MFADTFRRAVMAAPRSGLPGLGALLWKGFAEGQVSEVDAEALSTLLALRAKTPAPVTKPAMRPRRIARAGMLLRRRWAASGWLPPVLARHFTQAELAVLSVVASECAAKGRCGLTIALVAARAGVGRTTAKKALREARARGALSIEVRRRSRDRNAPNLVRVTCPDWSGWLRKVRCPPRGGGVGKAPARSTGYSSGLPAASGIDVGRLPEGRARGAPRDVGHGGAGRVAAQRGNMAS